MRALTFFAFLAVACDTPAAPEAPMAEPAPPAVEAPPPATAAAMAAPSLPDGTFALPDGAQLQMAGGQVKLVQGGGLADVQTTPIVVAGRPGFRLEMATGPIEVFVADDGSVVLGDGTGVLTRQ